MRQYLYVNNVNLPIIHKKDLQKDPIYEHTGYEEKGKNDISSIIFSFISIVPSPSLRVLTGKSVCEWVILVWK
jgi:hypothetical protein